MKYLLLHPASFRVSAIAPALGVEEVETRVVAGADGLAPGEVPTVFVLDPPSRSGFDAAELCRFIEDGGAVVALGAEGERDVPETLPDQVLTGFVPHPHGPRQLLVALRGAYRAALARRESQRAQEQAGSRTRELEDLTRIGMALATERDYDTLLDLILSQAREITASDAGSLYLVEKNRDGPRTLHFKDAQNFSRPKIPFIAFTMPLDRTSIAGYAATTGQPLVIDDAYELPEGVEYSFNRSFDQKYGYRTQSLLTIPMKDHRDEVIGVLQLINRKRHAERKLLAPADFAAEVIPYPPRLVDLVSGLAGQAAVSIENSRLYEDIERLFEGFVRAAVTAIEARDPTTFGHSGRVAAMTVGLAETVDRTSTGPYARVRFSRQDIRELRYAGLLHDFGKVGVREQVLVKAKKLYPGELALIRQRHAFIRRTAERDFHRQRADYLERQGREGYEAFEQRLRRDYEQQLAGLDRFLENVLRANEPTVLPEGTFEELHQYLERCYEDLDGASQPYLRSDEVRFLTIRKGSLDDAERLEIESHVDHTYRFLLQIPWTHELQAIPVIAYGHHEKLDGSGYPRRVKGERIPIQTRMMTIADIFDALTASDRPYKRAVPPARALDIIAQEVRGGMLDADLARLFVEAKVFERTDAERMEMVPPPRRPSTMMRTVTEE